MLQPKIIEVKPLPNYQLYLKFETNEEKIFNVLPYISGDWFGKLKEERYFKTVRLSSEKLSDIFTLSQALINKKDEALPIQPRTFVTTLEVAI